ncbi:MAG: hypothetical protein ACD_74C00155G0016 [uncultured bacterium]|nr:MAG: hypothetical protein ACD_74C00155G0016 [uncultured bacterium]
MLGFRKKKAKKPVGPVTNLGVGYNLLKPEIHAVINLPDSHRKRHFWCFGTTGVGKSRLIEHIVEQDIRKGYSTVVMDPKGDQELFAKIVQIAREAGREEDLILVTPIFPDYSAIIDPLSSHFMKEELVAHICAGVQVGRDPFFFNVAYQVSLLVTEALSLMAEYAGEKWSFNLNDVKKHISHTALKNLKDQIDILDTKEANELALDIGRVLENPPDYFSKIANSLDVALTELTRGNIGQIIGQADDNRFIKRLQAGKGVIMVVQLGSLLTKKAAFTAGKVLISMLQGYVGRVYAAGKTIQPALSLHIDEAQSVLYQGIEDLFAKGGSANLYISGYCQSVNQLFSELPEDRAKSILDLCNTKLFMRVPDADTAEYVSSHLGEDVKYSPMMSLGGGLTIREVEEQRVKPSEVLQMNNQEFFLMTYQGLFRGKTAHVNSARIEVVFPDLEGQKKDSVNDGLKAWGADLEGFVLAQREAVANG